MSCSGLGMCWGKGSQRKPCIQRLKENLLFKVLNTITRINLTYISWCSLQDYSALYFFQLEFPLLLKHTMYRAAMVTGIVLFT